MTAEAEPGYYERSRSALSRLQALVRSRAAGEQMIQEALDKATAEAEQEVARARKQIASARKKDEQQLAATYEANTAAINDRCTQGEAEAETTRRKLRKRSTDQYSATLQKLRAEYEDKRWTVDSLREADEKVVRTRHEQAKRELAAATAQIDQAWHTADVMCRRVHLQRSEVEFPLKRLPPIVTTDLLGKLQTCLEQSSQALAQLRASVWYRGRSWQATMGLFGFAGLLGVALTFPWLPFTTSLYLSLAWFVVGGLFLRVVVGVLAKKQVRDRARALAVYLADATRSAGLYREQAELTLKKHSEEIETTHLKNQALTAQHYEPRIATMERQLASVLEQIESNYTERIARLRQTRVTEQQAEDDRFTTTGNQTQAKHDAALAEAEANYQAKQATAKQNYEESWSKLTQNWFQGLDQIRQTCKELDDFAGAFFPAWEALRDPSRPLASQVPLGIRYGTWAVDQLRLPQGQSTDERLYVAEPIQRDVPALLPFPDRSALLLKSSGAARAVGVGLLQTLMLRFLTGLPPGKVRFTVIDPVGLGENFGSFMHLVDYDEQLMTNRIWTEPSQIEARLADLTEHMENVIQKYLRNQYKSIEDYNRAAGEVAEPYRVLVVANFPVNFTTEAARRLVSIAASGPACGVCTLVSLDRHATLPRDFHLADLEQIAFVLNHSNEPNGRFVPQEEAFRPFPLALDPIPSPEQIAQLAARVGQAGLRAARVEVPFDFIMPTPGEYWRADAARGLEVPIGRAGATRRQQFCLGIGTAQHALVAGKTGSGKSTLLHALITNFALLYSPDEAELYLIDFKKGVEFKAYAEAQLPHARVIAIESEREFGVSVLQRLDGILRERGDRFRDAGVNDLASFRAWLAQNYPGETCPRILLIVDEFQEFFVEDDKLAQETALLLDRLVRQGRAFGVHVLLGSQTLGGAYSLARSTIDQMAVRIALQCSEADAQLILSKDNTAARLLNRPGEAIYNDANGLSEGNDPFQVVWLSDDRREAILAEIRERGTGRHWPKPIIFEGSATADLTKNVNLHATAATTKPASSLPRIYLGEPIAIQDPTSVLFRPQSAANLLLLGQHEDAALGLLVSSMLSLLQSFRPADAAKVFTLLDGTPEDSEFAPYLHGLIDTLQLTAARVTPSHLTATIQAWATECEQRRAGALPKTPRVLFVHGLHRLRELRKAEDDFSFGRKDQPATPSELFSMLLREGPPVGLHVVCWCDSLTNLNRSLERSALREFGAKVLFQISATDSSQLIDTPAASRLGRHRALLVEEGNERPEKFRPYSLPSHAWLAEAVRPWQVAQPTRPEPSAPPPETVAQSAPVD